MVVERLHAFRYTIRNPISQAAPAQRGAAMKGIETTTVCCGVGL